ncbi:MAG: Asp-tRNA(Asn)/Glu-tRNA(Gln) amidotransferase subunit GatB [Anaerolineales bacterium]
MQFEAVIGMEVHAQVLTRSKMFCACSADYASAPPNTHTCPVCLALPGVLPVINRAAVEATVLTGMALNCTIPPFSKFDRKNYHYPDLPKGYQISQYDYPFCIQGYLDVNVAGQDRRIRIRRVHLEEDTAKLIHTSGGSLIDFNRAGVPLMEIVTEADIRSADEAHAYLTKLRAILRYLGVSSADMEKGAMRCEVNISLRPLGTETLGTKVEIKNLTSFRSVRSAIAYEIERQSRAIEAGEAVEQVTMGWDEDRQCTVFQRSKEYAEDYRYFPEPDLPPVELSAEILTALRSRLPELPDAKALRLQSELGLKPADAALLVADRDTATYFEQAVAARPDIPPQTIANWIVGEVFRYLGESEQSVRSLNVRPEMLAELVGLVHDGTINNTVGKQVLAEMMASGEGARSIVARLGLAQISDADALAELIAGVLAANPGPVQQYRAGEPKVLGFLIGQAMRATAGKANAQVVRELLLRALGESNS